MGNLVDSLNKTATTENGALQYQTTGSYCLDFFTKVGSLRKNIGEAYSLFRKAHAENPNLALRILLWSYDCRGGAGERAVFKHILLNAFTECVLLPYAAIVKKIPEYGRWDMLVDLLEDPIINNCNELQLVILETITLGLMSGNALCAKWMPRQGWTAERIRNFYNQSLSRCLTRKTYRKMLVDLSRLGNVVEQKMSAKQWNDIDFSKVPSIASTRYANAFSKNSQKYKQYLEDLKNGKTKMNMSVSCPHECARMLRSGRHNPDVVAAANLAYTQLCKNTKVYNKNILVMADVSGSMDTPVSGSVKAIDISTATAIYISEHNTGKFKDCVLTFSDDTILVKLVGEFSDKYHTLMNTQNPYGTDFEGAYLTILNAAVRDKLTNEDMPDVLLVVTDMEFDCESFNDTHVENIKRMFELHGYTMPELVFWNLGQRSQGYALTDISTRCGMISGFSPAILDSVFDGTIDPTEIMLRTVMIDRYKVI